MKSYAIEMDERLEKLVASRGGVLTVGVLFEMRG